MNDLHYLVLSTLLTWIMLMAASLIRARGWTPTGLLVAFGNRDNVAEASPLAGRADRAAKNMLENLVLFTALLVAARLAGAHPESLVLGAKVFFWARVVYFVVYLAGIRYLRTLIWSVAVAGMGIIAAAAFGA